MKLFGQVVRTVVNVVTLPVAVVQDVFTLGGVATEHGSYIIKALERLKDDASEQEEEP